MKRRRLTPAGPAARDEQGAVAVIVALMMVVLLGFVAITLDIGRLYAEKAELQNGADAAALAIAQDCAAGNCGNISATAASLAGANAKDGYATAKPLVKDGYATAKPLVKDGTVTVETGTLNKDGSTTLDFFFAPVLGISDDGASARASAGWGSPASGPAVFPMAFSKCQFDPALSGTVRLIEHDAGPSCKGTTGNTIPGGFGWLETGGKCSVDVSTANARTNGDNGNSYPLSGSCKTAMQGLKNKTILIPVFDEAGGNGSHGWYKIHGFAAFKVTGWKFGGNGDDDLNWNNTGTPSCTGSCRGIIGSFQKFVDLGSGYTSGGADLGASIVKLTG